MFIMPRILTWDGDPAHYAFARSFHDAATYADDVARTEAGEPTNPLSWTVGNSTAGFRNGTRVFLLRQGSEPRGIVAAGRVVNGTNRAGAHWADPSKEARYIDVVFDRVLGTGELLPLADLQRFVPNHSWAGMVHRQSGRGVGTELAAALLETLWAYHLGLSRGERQGRGAVYLEAEGRPLVPAGEGDR